MKLSGPFLIGILVGVFAAPASVWSESPTDSTRDSGRFSLAAACSQDGKWLNCLVSARDLVYDSVLLPEQKLSATLQGELSGSVQFELHPAQGKPQQVSLAVGMVQDGTKPALATVAVQLHEGEHVLQSYSLTFPLVEASH